MKYLFRLHNDGVAHNQWELKRDYDTIDGAKSFCKQVLRDIDVAAVHIFDAETEKYVGQMVRQVVFQYHPV